MRNESPLHRPMLVALVGLATTSTLAHADEHRSSAMLWGSALDGQLQIGPGTADFSMSVEDILNVLDGSITLRHESRGESHGWYAEYVYNDLKKEVSGALGEQQANMQQTILELGMSTPVGEDWEFYGGLRSEQVDNSIDFAVLPTARASIGWTDVLFGLRWQRESEGSRWWARGDLAGGGSDGAYLFEAGGAWTFNDSWEFSLAYRMLDTQIADGTMALDLTQAGAVIGISKEW